MENIDIKINEQKEELSKWKNELKKNLSINSVQKQEIFLISKYWLDKYEKILSNKNVNEAFTSDDDIILNNNTILGCFTEKNIKIEDLPKVFPLNKNIWANIQKENNDELTSITSIGIYSNKLLVINVLNTIYCFFFLDNKSRIRQGYLNIINIQEENKIINDFHQKGVFEFIKKNQNELDDNKLEISTNDYKIYIFEYYKLNKNNIIDDDFEEITIFKRRSMTLNPSIPKGQNMGEKTKFIFGSKIFNVNKSIKLNVEEKMGNVKNIFKKYFELIELNRDSINAEKKDNNQKIKEDKDKNKIKEIPEKKEEKKEEKKIIEISIDISEKNISKEEPNILRGKKDAHRWINTDNNNYALNEFLPQPMQKVSTPGIIGLGNIGATCYMNATLQCFSNIRRLRNYLINNFQLLQYNKNKLRLSFALVDVLKNLWQNLYITYYEPKYFKQIISEMNPLFKGIQANDPKDLVLFLLETMHKELNYPTKKNFYNNFVANNSNFNEVFTEFINDFTSKNNSIICQEFYGCINSMTTCGYCGITIHNVQVMNILFFPLEEVRKFMMYQNNTVKIEDCFKYNEKQEIYSSFYCNNCRQIYPAYNQSKLIYVPPTLIINLNRGKGIEFNVNIDFDEYLNVRKYVYANDSFYFYELVGVICHLGTNDMGGHFIAYCKNSNNCEWYKYNDSIVTKCDFKEIKNSRLPYVLFYSYLRT